MKLNCIRTNLTTGEQKTEEHRATLYHSKTIGWCLRLEPGVTGYESVIVTDFLSVPPDKHNGWSACAGTPGSWDKLYVPKNEMNRLRDIIELLPIK